MEAVVGKEERVWIQEMLRRQNEWMWRMSEREVLKRSSRVWPKELTWL